MAFSVVVAEVRGVDGDSTVPWCAVPIPSLSPRSKPPCRDPPHICAHRPPQVGAGSVQQVDDGVIHTNLILVCKLQGVHGAAHLLSKNQSLKDLHGTGGQCYWPVDEAEPPSASSRDWRGAGTPPPALLTMFSTALGWTGPGPLLWWPEAWITPVFTYIYLTGNLRISSKSYKTYCATALHATLILLLHDTNCCHGYKNCGSQ